ncbi:helix-turn-helix domain-containing protein [Kitasatospora sp. NPDC059160]|uniref:helix-turn-helix domain-containing protein n=1 Tax=Kitasatospora sp. NPDC059160 TaxID=3346748 RepID=UPI0036C62589
MATNAPRTSGAFTADVTTSAAPDQGFARFRDGWEAQVGTEYPAPRFTPGATGDFRISARAVRVHDSVIAEVESRSLIGTNDVPDHCDDLVLMHVVRHGSWNFARRRDGEIAVPAGGFMAQRAGPVTFEAARSAAAKVLILPADDLGPLIGDRLIAASAHSAEMRLLLAHTDVVRQNLADLTASGAQSAHRALIELAGAVLRQQADAAEPQLAPALARAARNLADARLTDPELSPTLLARELNVSVRTLHRAFGATDETVAGYVRRRRLELARRELAAPQGRPAVSELAARWQFADSSHFIRAFKRQYGLTPTEFARAAGKPAREGDPGEFSANENDGS